MHPGTETESEKGCADGRKSPRRIPESTMSAVKPQRILIADDNPIMRETLAQWLSAQAHEVITADTGERAFLALRDWSHPIGWLYTRAVLPGLVDGWILADQYHEVHENRVVILAGAEQRSVFTRRSCLETADRGCGIQRHSTGPCGREDGDFHNGRGRGKPGGLRSRVASAGPRPRFHCVMAHKVANAFRKAWHDRQHSVICLGAVAPLALVGWVLFFH